MTSSLICDSPGSGMDAKFGCRRHFMPQARGRHRPVATTRRAKWMEIARQDQARQLVVEACASHFTLTSFEACLNAFRSMRPYSRSCFARVAFAVVAALLCVGQHDRRPRNHDHRRCRAAARTRRRGRHMTSWLPHTTALTIRRYAGLPPGGGRGAKQPGSSAVCSAARMPRVLLVYAPHVAGRGDRGVLDSPLPGEGAVDAYAGSYEKPRGRTARRPVGTSGAPREQRRIGSCAANRAQGLCHRKSSAVDHGSTDRSDRTPRPPPKSTSRILDVSVDGNVGDRTRGPAAVDAPEYEPVIAGPPQALVPATSDKARSSVRSSGNPARTLPV